MQLYLLVFLYDFYNLISLSFTPNSFSVKTFKSVSFPFKGITGYARNNTDLFFTSSFGKIPEYLS